MDFEKAIRRFLIPGPLVTALCWVKYRAFVSPRAEVELTRSLRIGQGSRIGSFCKVKSVDGSLRIGARVDIGSGCFVAAGPGGLVIGDRTLIGPNVSIVGNDYRYDKLHVPVAEQEKVSRGTRIGRNVWIGAGSVILDGAVIEDDAIIGAGSVVQGRVSAGVVAMGHPARPMARRGDARRPREASREEQPPGNGSPVETPLRAGARREEGPRRAEPGNPRPGVQEAVVRMVAECAGTSPDRVRLDRWAPESGVDSFGLVFLREDIETTFGVSIPDDVWLGFASIHELCRYLAHREQVGRAREVRASVVEPAPSPEGPISGRWLSPDGVFYERLEIGMPHTGLMNLAETPLLKQVGDLRWAHISALTGLPSKELADADGHRLYPSFFFVDLAFPEDRPMASFGENDAVLLAETVGRYGTSMLDGTVLLLPTDAATAAPHPTELTSVERALAAGIPAVRLSNIFVMQFDGAEWLKKSRPADPRFERIPELPEKPDSWNAVKGAQQRGFFDRPGPSYLPMSGQALRVEYELVPDRDLNGAGLVYFANYPAILDVCERRALRQADLALHEDLIDRRTVIRRRSAYLSNASRRDSIVVEIEPWIETPRVEASDSAAEPSIRLHLDYRMTRKSDGRTMLIGACRKAIHGTSIQETPLAGKLAARAP